MSSDKSEMPYRYRLTFDVVIDGDGVHSDGLGARATALRLQAALKADERVVRVGTVMPRYIGPRMEAPRAAS